jgi:hypothetical protein
MFVELSRGNVHAPAGNSPTVVPVLAFGWTYGLNGASWHPYYFDGQIWRKVDPITQTSNWNFLFMRVRSTQVYLEGREGASGSVTYSRAYTGAFDRITIRTQSNDGSTRSFDDIYLDGGWVVTPPPDTPPTITQQPSNQNVCAGSTAQFTVTADGPGTLTYQWQKNSANFTDGGHYSGVTTAMLTVSPADTTDVASYRCVVSNVGGSAISNQAALALKVITVADFDLDCDVDDADFLQFDACFTGPQVPGPPVSGCTAGQFDVADSDGDMDVDQTDFAVFQRCYSGEGNPADPGCAD